MTRTVKHMRQVARYNPLHPLMIVIGIVLVAATAKLGHAMWGIGGMLVFYPAYLGMLLAGQRAAALLSRLIVVPQVLGQSPAYASLYIRASK